MRKPNKFAHMADGTVIVMLERRNGTVLACFVDAQDWEKVRVHRWYANENGHTFYAATHIRKEDGRWTVLKMHALLLPAVEQVDHEDGNGLNNRRSNLREATHSQNRANSRKHKQDVTSKYRGVSWHKRSRKFAAQIQIDGKNKRLGYFVNEEEAANAYNNAALDYFGAFAKLNVLKNELGKAA